MMILLSYISSVALGFFSLLALINWEKEPIFFMTFGIIMGGLSLYRFVETIFEHYKSFKK